MTFTAQVDECLTGIRLFDDIRHFIRRYIVLTDDECVALALWVMHTYCFSAGENTPYVNITSPSAGNGKSQLLLVLKFLVKNPALADSFTTAALVRSIDKNQPTLLVDEIDAFFSGNKERAEVMRGVLNGGFSREGTVVLCDGPQHTLRELKTFCPKAFAGIGRNRLPQTVRSRSIPIKMMKKRADEKVAKLKKQKIRKETDALKERLETWATHHMSYLENAEPEPAPGLTDRSDDVWESLLAIADRLGAKWAKQARQVATRLSGNTDHLDDHVNEELLCDVFRLIPEDTAFISTKDLLSQLHSLEESPWGTWSHGHPMTPRALAERLTEFDIFPRSNGRVRGYDRDRFVDAWARYGVGHFSHEASNRQATNNDGAGVTDALTVHSESGRHRREWTDLEIHAMEKAGLLLRPDYLERLQRLSDTAKLNI